MNKFTRFLTVIIYLVLFFSFLSMSPSRGGFDPYEGPERIMYYIVFVPTAVVGVISALIGLNTELGRVRKSFWLLIYLCLLAISLSVVITPLFLQVRNIFTPIRTFMEG